MKNNIHIKSIILLTLISFTYCGLRSANTYAIDDILKTAGFSELVNVCYKQNHFKPNLDAIANKFKVKHIFKDDKDGLVAIPNQYNNTITDYNLSCEQLVNGYTLFGEKYPALIESKTDTLTQSEAVSFVKKMGYKSTTSGGNNNTKTIPFSFKYSIEDPRPNSVAKDKTHSIKVTGLDKDNNITQNSIIKVTNDGNPKIAGFTTTDNGTTLEIDCTIPGTNPSNSKCGKVSISPGSKFITFVENVYNQLENNRASFKVEEGNIWEPKYKLIKYTGKLDDPNDGLEIDMSNNDGNELDGQWSLEHNAAEIALQQNNSGFSSTSDIKFTEDQKKTLHQHYFKNFYKAKILCEADGVTIPATAIITKVTKDGQDCFANLSHHSGEKVHAIKPDLTWYVDYDFEKLVSNMTEDELLGADSAIDPNNPDNGDSTSAERDPDCHTKAGALGWIICPLIESSTNTVQMIYDDLIQPYLSIDAALFDTNEKGGQTVRQVWGLFQGIANLAFVVLFLVVIFSQLTGIGIDNYGIKKILPKLIIGAVLINMSYIICQLAVDISNILGRAIASMFQQFADGINKDLAGVSVNLYPEQATAVDHKFDNVGGNTGNGSGTILLVIVCIAGVLGVKAFLAAGWAILIPVLLTALSLVIGVIFLFALLALRQAVAVILVAVSPIAFAAYMLPNTKKIFDKWFEAFKGMLLAYPIASALVFGGDLVSKILLVADGSQTLTSLGLLISAALVGIAPIFFIPSVIKKSMSAISGLGLGNIGKRIQSFTDDKVHKPAAERLNRSFLNDYKLRRKEENEAIANDRRMNKKGIVARKRLAKYDGKDPAKMKGILNGGDRNRARYRQALRDEAAYAKSEADLSGSYISSLDDTSLSKRAMDGLVEGDMEKFGSAIDEIGGRDQGKLLALLTNMSEQESWKNMDTRRKTAVAAKLRGQKGNPFAQAYGKLLAQESAGNVRSFNTLAGDIQNKVKENGAANLASMDKDVYKWLNGGYNRKENEQRTIFHNYDNNGNIDNVTKSFAVDSFTSNDLAEAMGQVSGAQQDQFAQFIRTRGKQNDDAGAVSDAQLANGANAAIAAAYAGAEKEEIEDAADSGQIASAELKRKINTTFETQINNIKKNNELASATNKGLADATGIKVGPQEVVLVGIERNTEND